MSRIIEKPLEAKQDTIVELTRLISLTENNQAKIYLQREVDRQTMALENQAKIEQMAAEIKIKQEQHANTSQIKTVAKQAGFKRKTVSTYSWDQSDKRIKFYLKGTKNLVDENDVQILYPEDEKTSDKISILCTSNADKQDYLFEFPRFSNEINRSAAVTIKVKSSYVLVSLAKKESGNWDHLLAEDQVKAQAKADQMANMGGLGGDNADPQAGMMNMMKKMYEDGDDEMKRSLNKAWEQSRNGQGGMPGMGGMGAGMGDAMAGMSGMGM